MPTPILRGTVLTQGKRSEGPCSMESCVRDARTRGMCPAHYEGDRRSRTTKVCTVADCVDGAQNGGRGFCPRHYARWQRSGTPDDSGLMRRPAGVRAATLCLAEGCDRAQHEKWMPHCSMHGSRIWRAANPERVRANNSNRRARKFRAFVEYVDPYTVWKRDGGVCHICTEMADETDWHMDHVVALVRGGEHSYANVKVSHPTCNLKKGPRLL